MTYCVGLLVDGGAVLLSDTRTNAGIDNISTYRKTFTFESSGERAIVMMTAGSLSVTQMLVARLEEQNADPDGISIMSLPTMLGIAEHVGREAARARADIARTMTGGEGPMPEGTAASIILCGQRTDGAMRLFLIYPEGNFIEATEDTPYLQIGEHKYGKPILDRVVTRRTSLTDCRKAALLSMDSTLRSNLSVGVPLDLTVLEEGACRIGERVRIEEGDPGFGALSEGWSEALRDAFGKVEMEV